MTMTKTTEPSLFLVEGVGLLEHHELMVALYAMLLN